MIFDKSAATLANTILWVSQCMGSYALFAQALTHYRLKTTNGLSSYMIWLLYTSGLLSTLFTVLSNDPLPIRIITPLQMLIVATYVIQEFVYASTLDKTVWLVRMYLLATIIHICAITLLLLDCATFHSAVGWSGAMLMSLTSVPQMAKQYRMRTTHGVSYQYVLINFTRTLLSCWSVWFVLSGSNQFGFTLIRAALTQAILTLQKLYYGDGRATKEKVRAK